MQSPLLTEALAAGRQVPQDPQDAANGRRRTCAADWCHPRITKLEPRLFGETAKWTNTIGFSGVLVGCLLINERYCIISNSNVTLRHCKFVQQDRFQLRLCGTQFYKCSRKGSTTLHPWNEKHDLKDYFPPVHNPGLGAMLHLEPIPSP